MFSIAFSDEPLEYLCDDPTIASLHGQIVMGDATPEGFSANLFVWSRADYEAQWRRELVALVDGHDKATLVVNFSVRPEEVWNAYRDTSTVHFQNRLLSIVELPEALKIEELSTYLGDRETSSECGSEISEWQVDLSDITEFLNQ